MFSEMKRLHSTVIFNRTDGRKTCRSQPIVLLGFHTERSLKNISSRTKPITTSPLQFTIGIYLKHDTDYDVKWPLAGIYHIHSSPFQENSTTLLIVWKWNARYLTTITAFRVDFQTSCCSPFQSVFLILDVFPFFIDFCSVICLVPTARLDKPNWSCHDCLFRCHFPTDCFWNDSAKINLNLFCHHIPAVQRTRWFSFLFRVQIRRRDAHRFWHQLSILSAVIHCFNCKMGFSGVFCRFNVHFSVIRFRFHLSSVT